MSERKLSDVKLGEDPRDLDDSTVKARYLQFTALSIEHALGGDLEGRDVWERAAERFSEVARQRGISL